jgi:ABC-2 type transport system permease protein
MSAVVEQPPAPAEGPPVSQGPSGLLRAESHRFRARRFVQVLFGLAVLGWLATTVISLTQFGTFSAQNTVPGAIGFAVAGSALALVLGATWIGAEWSTRSLVSLLFWEPRRVRVMAVKLAVLALGAALLGILLQAAWLATASILDATAGDGRALRDGFWGDLLGTQARGVLLTVLAAVGGFGLTSLVRNTGAALGIGFVYFAVVETAVAILRPAWQPWLLSSSVAGLVLPGGHTVVLVEEAVDPATGSLVGGTREVLVGNLQGGLVLGLAAGAAVVLGVVLFARRDVQ